MKKFASMLMVAGFGLAMASCSTTDEPMATPNSDITIAVKAPVEPMGRAAVDLPEGYTMHCIMQLLDENNNTVGAQKTAAIDAATGTGTFTITAADQEQGAKALFWAEYINSSEESVYNTADLKAVSYATTDFTVADAPATDAFCGKLDALTDGANVTLTRPFANVNFKPTNPEKVAAATKMVVTYTTPAGYNVLNGTVDATKATKVTYTNASFDSNDTPWFSTFVFAAADATTLDSAIEIALSEGLTQTITIGENKVPLNENFQISVSAEIGDVELSDITVTVGVDPGYNKPEAPKFEVGAYVNAAGEPVATAAEAAGVVYLLGANGSDAADKYDAKFAGKTIKGYAVALNNVNASRQTINTDPVPGLTQTSWANGFEGTPGILNSFAGSAFVTTFTDWRTANATTGDNASEWYIPTLVQLQSWMGMLYPIAGNEATGSDAFKALFPLSNLTNRTEDTTVNYASCSINQNGNVSIVRLSTTGDNATIQAAQMSTSTAQNQSALCRPMFTIFE